MKNIVDSEVSRDREFIFADRTDAGRQLAELMRSEAGEEGILLAIPAGGVPVALAMQATLSWPLELVLVRKVQIPWNTEAGFGAINLDGDRLFNEPLLHSLHLSQEVIDSQVQKALRSIMQRNKLFLQERPLIDLTGKKTVIVDDGLASGFTMLAALRYVRKRHPSSLLVAVPTGLGSTVARIAEEVDRLYCPNIRNGYPFAVANAYRSWFDIDEADIVTMLAEKG